MTTSTSPGTFGFAPSAADVVLNAFALICMRRTDLDTYHLTNAAFQLNLLLVDVSNRNPNGWEQEVVSVPVVAGQETYTLPGRTLIVCPAMLSVTDANGNTTERMLGAISRSDYASYPQKDTQGPPSSFSFALTNPPTITLYPTPDDTQTYALNLYTFRQSQDAVLSQGYTLDAPYRALDAITTGLAARLGEMYPDNLVKVKGPQAIDRLHAQFEDRFRRFAGLDQEAVPISVVPMLNGYFTR